MSSNALIVGIAGGTASGKTTLVNELLRTFADVGISSLCFDSYYRELSHLSFAERDALNFDAPDIFDVELFREHLGELKKGNSIRSPIYDYASYGRKAESTLVKSERLILLDGFLLLHDDIARAQMDLTAFIDADAEIRFQRRLKRDVQERGRTEESVVEWWHTRVYPSHVRYCEPTKKFANIVLGERDTWVVLENAIRKALGDPSDPSDRTR